MQDGLIVKKEEMNKKLKDTAIDHLLFHTKTEDFFIFGELNDYGIEGAH